MTQDGSRAERARALLETCGVAAEFELRDIDRTMATMVEDPYLNHVAVMTGGRDAAEVRRFTRTTSSRAGRVGALDPADLP